MDFVDAGIKNGSIVVIPSDKKTDLREIVNRIVLKQETPERNTLAVSEISFRRGQSLQMMARHKDKALLACEQFKK